ncbi:MAG: ECF transporter S component, partial [Candidatus Aminicenantes bacterium]
MKKYSGYDLLLGGLFMALALVFPMVFHAVGLGSAFLPMFYPIAAAGFLVALPVALVVGTMSPLVSALITGMPPF